MRDETKTFIISLLKEFTVFKTVFFLFMVSLVGNLSALVDALLHPDIPYFDEEHLIIGGVYAVFLTIVFLALAIYAAKIKMASKKLEESEKKYRDITELLPQFVFELDGEGKICFLNRHAMNDLGYTQDDLDRGLHALQMFMPADQNRVSENIKRVLSGESLENLEFMALKKDGAAFPVLLSASSITHENTVTGIRGIAIDITERKHAEDEIRRTQQEWERTFDAITDPIMILDTRYKIIKANKAMADKLGVSPSMAVGLTCYKAAHDKNEPLASCPHTALLLDGLSHSAEVYEERFGGHYIVSVSPLFSPDGTLYGSVHYASDITERKMAELQIQKLNEELELKVQERTKQLLTAQAELVRKEKMATLGQLSESVGHELRNPMGVISNAVYFLETVMPNADERVVEYLDIIRGEVNTAQRIISDLLDFTRTKTPRRDMIAVDQLIKQSIGKCTVAEGISLHVEIQDPLPAVMVDPLQLGQVLQNIITNAVQAMPDGGELRISARKGTGDLGLGVSKEEPVGSPHPPTPDRDFIEISVADTGAGISPENMSRIFEPLFTTKARGIGLGLIVSKKLIEANGGKIKVESQLGKGTTFTVILPSKQQAMAIPETGGNYE